MERRAHIKNASRESPPVRRTKNRACGLRSFIAINHPPHDTSLRQPCNTCGHNFLNQVALYSCYITIRTNRNFI